MLSNLVTLERKVLWLNEDGSVILDESQMSGDGTLEDEQQLNNEPFLKVSDRTVYKTKEDAAKAFGEAEKRITSLSGYQKVLEELGAPKDADANYLRGVLNEYIKLVNERDASKITPQRVTPGDGDKEFEGQDPQLVAQTKRGRQWLKDNAEKVGLISRDQYSKLEKDFNDFKAGFSQKDEVERKAAIEDGQQKITSWLSDSKVDLNSEEREELEDLIVAYVNSKPALEQKWIQGDRSQKLEIIRSGYEKFLGVVKPGASPVGKAASVAAAGRQKIGLLNRTPRRLPNDGGSQNGKGEKKPLRIGDPSLRAKAMEMMAKMDAERGGAGD